MTVGIKRRWDFDLIGAAFTEPPAMVAPYHLGSWRT